MEWRRTSSAAGSRRRSSCQQLGESTDGPARTSGAIASEAQSSQSASAACGASCSTSTGVGDTGAFSVLVDGELFAFELLLHDGLLSWRLDLP